MRCARRSSVVGLAFLAACGGGAAPPSDAGADVAAEAAGAADADGDGDASDATLRDASLIDVGLIVVDGGDDAGDGATPPRWRSGTRLRAVVLEPVDAPDAIFQQVHDKQLGSPCAFHVTADGATRCVPLAASIAYADAACETPVLLLPAACTVPRQVSRVEACRATGFGVGARRGAAAPVYDRTAQGCAARDASAARTYDLSAMPDASFVSAVELRDDRGGDLAMRYWQSEDGGLFPIGVWDTERGASCVAGRDRYEDRCVPRVTASVPVAAPADFSDATCKTPAAVRAPPASCDPEPVSAVELPEEELCGAGVGYASATPVAAPYRVSGGACTAAAASPANQDFASGAPIDSFALPTLTTVLEGVGRLKIHRYLTAMCLPVDIDPAFHDTLAQLPCAATPTAAGLRCVPQGRGQVSYFSDAACTAAVYVESTPAGPDCVTPRPRFAARPGPSDGCGGTAVDLFEIGGQVTPAKLYAGGGASACAEAPVDPATLSVFSAAPAADLSALPALELVTE